MRKLTSTAKDATTVAVAVPLSYLSMLAASIALAVAWVVAGAAERFTRQP